MGVRLQGEFRTLRDDQYQVQIIDSTYTGAVTNINLSGDGFTLTHDGETDTVYSPIVGSSVEVGIYNDSAAVDSFRTALLNAQDKQFSIRILRYKKPADRDIVNDYRNRVVADGGEYTGGNCLTDKLTALGVGSESRSNIFATYTKDRVETDGGTFEAENCVVDGINALGGTTAIPQGLFELYWTGFVAQDLIEEADESKPRLMQLIAADGMSLLSTVDYEFTLSQSRTLTFKDVVIDILERSDVSSLFESDEVMLTSVVNWYAEEHSYSATLDPFDNTRADLKAFTSLNSEGEREYTNSLQVIREIATILNARFYFDNGSFRFEQISERDRLVNREFYYLKDGTADGNAEVLLDTLVNQEIAHRSGGTFRYLPAVKSVVLTRLRQSSANLIGRSVVFPNDEIDVGLIPSVDNGRIILQMKTEMQTYISSVLQGTATPVFGVTIRLEPSDGSATKYWKNTMNTATKAPVFGSGSWSATVDTYKWAANTISRASSLKTITQHAITTGPLPTDGEVFLDIEFVGFFDFGIDPTFIASPNSYSYSITLQTAQYENDNDPSAVVSSEYRANNTNTGVGSNITVDLGSARLGDGAGAIGSIYVYNGTTWVPSTGWRANNIGSYTELSKLTTRETLALQSSVVHRYEGVIINGGGSFLNRLRFDGLYWLPLRSTLSANSDELQVEVFKIARVIDDTAVSEPVDTTESGLVASVADFRGQYINIADGTIAGMDVDSDENTIGPYSETATGTAEITADTQITGTADITGAATMPSAQLTGGTGAQGTMVWNGDEDTIALTMNGIDHELGQDMMYNVKNQSGSTIPKGVAVRASGTLGSSGRILIERMSAAGDIPARFYLGVTAEEIADGADGKIIEFGKIRGLNTEMYSDGDVLWLNPATTGTFTATEPTAPDLKIATAFVVHSHATNGVIMVRANQGHKLQDAHDVRITSLADGDILRWSNDLQVWYNTPLPT